MKNSKSSYLFYKKIYYKQMSQFRQLAAITWKD